MIWSEKGKEKKSLNPNLSFWLYKGKNKRHLFCLLFFMCQGKGMRLHVVREKMYLHAIDNLGR